MQTDTHPSNNIFDLGRFKYPFLKKLACAIRKRPLWRASK